MRISNPFRYAFKAPYKSSMCVYKCWFGKKYLICTAKALHQSVNQLAVELDRRLRLGISEDSIHYKTVKHILRGRVGIFEVEMVLETESPVEMLKGAYKALRDAKNDPDCLNMSFIPHEPQWIPMDDRAQYSAWVKRYGTPKKKPVKKKNAKA